MCGAVIGKGVSARRFVAVGEAAAFQPVREAVDAVHLQPQFVLVLASQPDAQMDAVGCIQFRAQLIRNPLRVSALEEPRIRPGAQRKIRDGDVFVDFTLVIVKPELRNESRCCVPSR